MFADLARQLEERAAGGPAGAGRSGRRGPVRYVGGRATGADARTATGGRGGRAAVERGGCAGGCRMGRSGGADDGECCRRAGAGPRRTGRNRGSGGPARWGTARRGGGGDGAAGGERTGDSGAAAGGNPHRERYCGIRCLARCVVSATSGECRRGLQPSRWRPADLHQAAV